MKQTLFTLLVVGAFANHASPASQTPDKKDPTQQLFDAVKDNNINQVRSCLARGAGVNAIIDHCENTPLHLAAYASAFDTIALLIQHGANVHARNIFQETPLHKAVFVKGQLAAAIARQLIEAGADVNAKDGIENTPLHRAISSYGSDRGPYDRSTIVLLLLEHGANVHAIVTDQETPLHRAPYANVFDTLTLLLQHGADVHARNELQETPLHSALYLKGPLPALIIAKLLIEAGANVNARDDEGNTPLHNAALFGSTDFARVILRLANQRPTR